LPPVFSAHLSFCRLFPVSDPHPAAGLRLPQVSTLVITSLPLSISSIVIMVTTQRDRRTLLRDIFRPSIHSRLFTVASEMPCYTAGKRMVHFRSVSATSPGIQATRTLAPTHRKPESGIVMDTTDALCACDTVRLTRRCSQPLHRVQPHFRMFNTRSFQSGLAAISGG
jgi:hypothetical protein